MGAGVPDSPRPTSVGADDFVFPHRYWVQNEHCQVLNVWTQITAAATKKPVMVWMHGGGFTNGSSMESYAYDGKTLSEFGDVVAVSVNHRLNIIGTLDLSAYGAEYANSRNTGMADLVAALQWVHENIEAFGGDPGNVTIFGQSGGGGKVIRLMHMPSAKGLFHKVICQSGGALTYRDTDPPGHSGPAGGRGRDAQEPEPERQPDRQAKDGSVPRPARGRHCRRQTWSQGNWAAGAWAGTQSPTTST